MQHRSVPKLAGGVEFDSVQGSLGPAGEQPSQAILELVAEATDASGLVVGAGTPQAARNALVGQPLVGHGIEALVGRFDRKVGQKFVLERFGFSQSRLCVCRGPEALDDTAHLHLAFRGAESVHQRGPCTGLQTDLCSEAGNRFRAAPAVAAQLSFAERKRGCQVAMPAKKAGLVRFKTENGSGDAMKARYGQGLFQLAWQTAGPTDSWWRKQRGARLRSAFQ